MSSAAAKGSGPWVDAPHRARRAVTISAFCLTPFALLLIVAWIGSLQRQSRAPDLGPLDAQRVWTTFPPGGEPTQMLRWTMDCAQQVEGSAAGMQQTVHLSGDHVTALDHYRTALVEDGWAIADPAEPVWVLEATKPLGDRRATIEITSRGFEPHGRGVILDGTIAPVGCEPIPRPGA